MPFKKIVECKHKMYNVGIFACVQIWYTKADKMISGVPVLRHSYLKC